MLCDVCGNEDGNTFIIREGEDARRAGVRVDLCDKHAKPVHDVLAKGEKVRAERKASRKAGQHSMTPYEG